MREVNWEYIESLAIEKIREKRKSTGKRENETDWMIKKEIARITKYLNEPKMNMLWLKENTSDDFLAQIIADWITKSFKDRKLFSQLDFKGIRYEYTPLIVHLGSAEKENQREEVEKVIEECQKQLEKNEILFNPMSRKEKILKKIVTCDRENFPLLVDELITINNRFILALYYEKNLANLYGLESVYSVRCIQYVEISEIMVLELLNTIVVKVQSEGQYEKLENIWNALQIYKMDFFQKINKICEDISYQELKINENGKKTSAITAFFVLYMQYRSYVEETKEIANILKDDIDKNMQEFFELKRPKYSFSNEYLSNRKLIADLEEGNSYGTSKVNSLYDAHKFIALYNKTDRYLGNPESMFWLKVVYREIFKNKAKLSKGKKGKITASSIARQILNGETVENREEIFLEMKIQRGILRELNLLPEYILLNLIAQIYREMLLEALLLPKDTLIYQTINAITESVLTIIKKLYFD